MTGQPAPAVRPDRLGVDLRRGGFSGAGAHATESQVGHQHRSRTQVAAREDGDRLHTGHRGDGRLHLAELDALSADLHLVVGAAQVLELAVGGPANQVAGPVHPRAVGAEGVGDEPGGGLRRGGVIADRELRTDEVELAGHADRHRTQVTVEDANRGARDRTADGDEVLVGGDPVRGHVDGRLGGAVQVHQLRRRPAQQAPGQLCAQGLSRGEHQTHGGRQRGASGGGVPSRRGDTCGATTSR